MLTTAVSFSHAVLAIPYFALQGTHDLYTTDPMTLPYWIIVFGATYFVFAMCVPHLHGLRWWSSLSSILVVVFVAIIFGVSIHDGALSSLVSLRACSAIVTWHERTVRQCVSRNEA